MMNQNKNTYLNVAYLNIMKYGLLSGKSKKFIFSVIISVIFSISLNVYAQLRTSSPFLESMQQAKKPTESINMNDMLQKDTYPVGNVVDATAYQIGPNDVLSIQIFPEVIPQLVVVTAESTILHPRFGEINAKDMTLQQLRDTLNFISTQKKEGAKVSVSLTQARKVFVTIRGNITSPGTYTLPATYSVSTAIRFASVLQTTTGISTEEEQTTITRLQEARKEREKIFGESGVAENSIFSSRNIKLVRSNGTAMIVDIERANATQDATFNPFIAEGDDIFVPFETTTDYPAVSIAGEVVRPASVVFKNGDMVSHIIKMGYGFTDNADLDNVVLFDDQGSRKLTVDSLGNLLTEDIKINSSSAVVVGRKTEKNKSNLGIVSVKGEVNNPNIYVIEKGKTKLRDVIEMAGGFTSSAYLSLATVGRRDNTQNEKVAFKRKYSEYFSGSNLTAQDTERFRMTIDTKHPQVSCDFVSVFENNSDEYNIILRDGDVINIPVKPHKVYVFGQVNRPGFVDFYENQTMEWYIMKAGGYATSAEKDRARIIRGNNKVWEDGFQKSVYVNDGDEIYVPNPRDVPPEMELQRWATYAGLVGLLATLINVFWGIYRDNRNLNR